MPVSADEARALALALPEAVEQDHHGKPSFRVGGKIFATLWNEGRMNVMVDEGGIRTAIAAAPEACEEVWWGKRLAAVGVALGASNAITSASCSRMPGSRRRRSGCFLAER